MVIKDKIVWQYLHNREQERNKKMKWHAETKEERKIRKKSLLS